MKICRCCRNLTVRNQQSRRLQKRVQLIHQLRCLLYNLTRKLLNSTASRTESCLSLFSLLSSLFSQRKNKKKETAAFLPFGDAVCGEYTGFRPPSSGFRPKPEERLCFVFLPGFCAPIICPTIIFRTAVRICADSHRVLTAEIKLILRILTEIYDY